ncbi:hypothetical protein [Paraburkholderia phytofirmans]
MFSFSLSESNHMARPSIAGEPPTLQCPEVVSRVSGQGESELSEIDIWLKSRSASEWLSMELPEGKTGVGLAIL